VISVNGSSATGACGVAGAAKPEIDPSYAEGKTVYMIGPHTIVNAQQTQPNLYAQSEELYIVAYPQDALPLPSGYQPQCNPCFHPGLPAPFVFHDHVLTGAPGLGTNGTAGAYKGPWKIIVMMYTEAAVSSKDFVPIKSVEDLDKVEHYLDEANKIKDLLINCNMRLVVSIAKRHAAQTDNFFELLSDGNMSLIRAVEKFDYSRGNKFSTYASWAIMKNFARSIPEEKRRRERYVTGHEEMFEIAPDTRSDEQDLMASAEQTKHRVNRLLESLDPRERQIIRMRAGLDNGQKPMTLEEIGKEMGITKERVRQLNVRIMKKLRDIAADQQMDMP